jgi:hypothetical protein
LLWVIPLAIYLLTFVLVFARKRVIPHLLMIRAFPILLLPLLIIIISQINRPLELLIPLHLTLFFVITMACHGALANDRPSAQRLTEFYLWISIGGALGGIFNALLAPIIFDTVAEYPLMLTLAALLTLNADDVHVRNKLDFILPLVLGSIVAGLILGLQAISIVSSPLQFGIAFGLPTLFCFSFSRRPLRFGLGIGAILLASTLYVSNQGRVLYTERSFFGVHRVLLLNQDGRYHALLHGTTLHGLQNFDSARRQREPLSYYYPTGPIGQVFEALGGQDAPRSVGAVGLGVGSIACYSQPGQEWTFYEIDPLVERIARNPRFFTFLQDCAPGAEVVLGDARLSLVYAPDAHYDLLILDAYSSDSIPLHLLTREALALYLDKLAPHGILAFHISNRYLGLIPVLANLSRDAGLVSYDQKDSVLSEEDRKLGKTGSQWVIMARETADLGKLAADPRWTSLKDQPHAAVWTDDFSSILNVLRW